MTETGQTASGGRTSNHPIDAFCDALRDGLHQVADAVTPPESATRHFRESRLEFLRGIRELIDHRINRMSRNSNRGTTVVVE